MEISVRGAGTACCIITGVTRGSFDPLDPGRKVPNFLVSSDVKRSHTRRDLTLPRVHPFILIYEYVWLVFFLSFLLVC
jgi:hypothetical protein